MPVIPTQSSKRPRHIANIRRDIKTQTGWEDWFVLHPSLNPTGSDTLRWSCSGFNEQNIGKQIPDCQQCYGREGKKEHCEACEGRGYMLNLRYPFGPAPGREWWSADAQNIELRVPAYEADETEMVAIFERPNDPPYFGSYHLLVFDVLHPELFAKHGKKVKELFESTWYQWVKNGNFAVGYGSVESSGTADRAYHVPGAFRKIKGRFSKIHGRGGLNDQQIGYAEKYGYVETLPDKNVDPTKGYPLLCARTNYGRILPTVPLNYHVQGSAMWWMGKAMVRCYNFLQQLNNNRQFMQAELKRWKHDLEVSGFHLIAQVHDELIFDFPKGLGDKPWEYNLPKVREIVRLMAMGGDDIGLPTPVSYKYHANTWSEGLAV